MIIRVSALAKILLRQYILVIFTIEAKIQLITMISPQGVDELYWGRDHEDVNDWV
jgi:hypothetical protein